MRRACCLAGGVGRLHRFLPARLALKQGFERPQPQSALVQPDHIETEQPVGSCAQPPFLLHIETSDQALQKIRQVFVAVLPVALIAPLQELHFVITLALPQVRDELGHLLVAHRRAKIQCEGQHGLLGAFRGAQDFVYPALHISGCHGRCELALDAVQDVDVPAQFFVTVPPQQGLEPALEPLPLLAGQIHVAIDEPRNQPVEVVIGKRRRAASDHGCAQGSG